MIGELPFALLLRVVKPAYIYGSTIVLFGLFATCCVATTKYAGLMVLRLLVGFAEAAAQTAFLYLALWYKPDELAMRTGRQTTHIYSTYISDGY
jgi:MFS family permease